MAYDVTIIYPPAIDYNFMHQRPQQMMKALAQAGANVIFLNPANIYPQVSAIVTPYPELPNFKVVRQGTAYNHLIEGKRVLWCAVNQREFIENNPHDLAVFDSCDLASDEFSVWKPEIPKMEKKTGLIVASAQAIYDEHKSRGCNVVLVPNGADYDHFSWATEPCFDRPSDLPDTGGQPLVGYYGAIYSWMDVEMVYKIADRYPVVLIGANPLYNRDIKHRNVTVLNIKDYRELPKYLSWFDVAIIPFKLSQMIKGCDPVKFYEYISAGKPVVASNMTELHKFKDVCHFADADTVADTIEVALLLDSPKMVKKRQRVAKENSWLARAELSLQKIREELGLEPKKDEPKRVWSFKNLFGKVNKLFPKMTEPTPQMPVREPGVGEVAQLEVEDGGDDFVHEIDNSGEGITVIMQPHFEFDGKYQRPQTIMNALAQLGVNVLYMNTVKQSQSIEYPYAELPNFHVVSPGTDVRHLLKGRIVLWYCDDSAYASVNMLGANLVVFDSIDKVGGASLTEMEKVSDVVFVSTQSRLEAHGFHTNNVHVLVDRGLEKQGRNVLNIIKRTKNRPAPLI